MQLDNLLKGKKMRQAIKVHKTASGKLCAQAYAGRKYFPWDYALNFEKNHTKAAQEYLKCRGWDAKNKIVGGSLANGHFVYVLIDKV